MTNEQLLRDFGKQAPEYAFGDFAPAYTISNEDQHWATRAVPGVSRVLTVAGSGDQALFYKLAGATRIDTFDRTKNARVVQDIKFAAIKTVDYLEYSNLLIDLYYSADILKIPAMRKIMPLLSNKTVDIINNPGNKYIFGAGMDARYYPENIPSPEEYKTLKKTLKRPFNFKSCDLYDLNTKITTKYDLINISNIFDYHYTPAVQGEILHNLGKHLNVGGYIAYLPQFARFSYNKYITTAKNYTLEYAKTITHEQSKMILFQRTR